MILLLNIFKEKKYIPSDEITFFVEDQYHSNNNDFVNRQNCNITDENILFTSCYVINDWSSHLISISLLKLIQIYNQSWGGVNLKNLEPYFYKTDLCFIVHKYHNIISENRTTVRDGPVEIWLKS